MGTIDRQNEGETKISNPPFSHLAKMTFARVIWTMILLDIWYIWKLYSDQMVDFESDLSQLIFKVQFLISCYILPKYQVQISQFSAFFHAFFSQEKKQSFLSELPLCSSTLLKLIERPHWKNLTDPPPPFKLMPLHVWRNPHFQSRDFFYDLQSSAAEAHFGIRVVTYAAGSRQCWYTLSTA